MAHAGNTYAICADSYAFNTYGPADALMPSLFVCPWLENCVVGGLYLLLPGHKPLMVRGVHVFVTYLFQRLCHCSPVVWIVCFWLVGCIAVCTLQYSSVLASVCGLELLCRRRFSTNPTAIPPVHATSWGDGFPNGTASLPSNVLSTVPSHRLLTVARTHDDHPCQWHRRRFLPFPGRVP